MLWVWSLLKTTAGLDTCPLFDLADQYFACQSRRLPLIGNSGDCRAECSGTLGELGFRTISIDGICVRYANSASQYVTGVVVVHTSYLQSFTCLGQYAIDAAVQTLRLSVATALNIPLSEISAIYTVGEALAQRRRLADTPCHPSCVMGTCVNGVCVCFDGFTGSHCQLEEPGAACACDDNSGCWTRSNLGCCRTEATLTSQWCGCAGTTGGLVDQVGSLWTKNLWRPCSVTFWCQDESGTSETKDITIRDVFSLEDCKKQCVDFLMCAYFEYSTNFRLCKISSHPKTAGNFFDRTVDKGNYLCEPRLNPCSLVDANFFGSFCGNHGRCEAVFSDSSDLVGQAVCSCRDGYSGVKCEQPPPADPCLVEPLCPGHSVCEARIISVSTDFGTALSSWAQANRLCSCKVGWTGSACDVKINITVRIDVAVVLNPAHPYSPGFIMYSVGNGLISLASNAMHLVAVSASAERNWSFRFIILSNSRPAEDVQLDFVNALAVDGTIGGLVEKAEVSSLSFLTSVPTYTSFPTALSPFDISVSLVVVTQRLTVPDISDLLLSLASYEWQTGLTVTFDGSGHSLISPGTSEFLLDAGTLSYSDFARKTVTTPPPTVDPNSGTSDSGSSVVTIVGAVCGVIGLVAFLLVGHRLMKRRKKQHQMDNVDEFSEDDLPRPREPPITAPLPPPTVQEDQQLTEEADVEVPTHLTLRGVAGRGKIYEERIKSSVLIWWAKNRSKRAKRRVMAAWHPDHAVGDEQKSVATRLFQWLTELK